MRRNIFDVHADLRYEETWAERRLPELTARSVELESQLPAGSLLAQVARLTAMPERAGPAEVIVLHFNQPHGIRIHGAIQVSDAVR